jgi:hypothetical protein
MDMRSSECIEQFDLEDWLWFFLNRV